MKEGENLVSWSVFLSHTNLDVPRGLRTLFSKEPVPLLQVAQGPGQHIWKLEPAGLLSCRPPATSLQYCLPMSHQMAPNHSKSHHSLEPGFLLLAPTSHAPSYPTAHMHT